MPPSITLEMAKGFTLYMVKALISGRGDEIIDLAAQICGDSSERTGGYFPRLAEFYWLPAGPLQLGYGNAMAQKK